MRNTGDNNRAARGICILCMLFFVLFVAGAGITPVTASAATKNISLNLDSTNDENAVAGNTGKFTVAKPESTSDFYSGYKNTESFTYASSNKEVMTVTSAGTYKALKEGNATITVTGLDSLKRCTMIVTYVIKVLPNMTKVTLSKKTVTINLKDKYKKDEEHIIRVSGDGALFDGDDLEYNAGESKLGIKLKLEENVITVSAKKVGTSTVTLSICGKAYYLTVNVVKVSLNTTSALTVKGRTKQLKIVGSKKSVKWKSLNKKIATVDENGLVTAVKTGNVVITATVSKEKLGCVVSVTSDKKKKVILAARQMGDGCTYSQPNRMQEGFYDCSSLVWRNYSVYGYTFGDKNYAPTAADQAKYLADKNKIVSGGFSEKNITKMKINPGDLLFETGSDNSRYLGIYHVEMFAGYHFIGFSKGKPVVGWKWANRADNYYSYGCGIIGRP